MAGKLFMKPGVVLTTIAPGGMRILEALKATAKDLAIDIAITCGNEAHEDDDPHTLGAAIDFRTHDWSDEFKQKVLLVLMQQLQRGPDDLVVEASQGLATLHFFGWIEHPGAYNEHCHVQVRRRIPFTIVDYLAA